MKNTINQDKIQELKDLDGEGEVLKELLGLFLPSTDAKIQKLLALSTNPKAPEIKPIAHEMRSSCANLGAEIMSDLATQLEYLPVDDSYQQNASGIIKKLDEEFSKVRSILDPLQ